MPMSGLPEDARERFFEKSSEKRERFQNFWQYTRCGRFFSKRVNGCRLSAYVLSSNFFWVNLNDFGNSGNIPDVEKFFEKSVSDFRFFAYALYVNRRNF